MNKMRSLQVLEAFRYQRAGIANIAYMGTLSSTVKIK